MRPPQRDDVSAAFSGTGAGRQRRESAVVTCSEPMSWAGPACPSELWCVCSPLLPLLLLLLLLLPLLLLLTASYALTAEDVLALDADAAGSVLWQAAPDAFSGAG